MRCGVGVDLPLEAMVPRGTSNGENFEDERA
jgi:hypothetical protein